MLRLPRFSHGLTGDAGGTNLIQNNLCKDCWHLLVCEKRKVMAKFDDDEKGYIGVDITMNRCRDFSAPDLEGTNES